MSGVGIAPGLVVIYLVGNLGQRLARCCSGRLLGASFAAACFDLCLMDKGGRVRALTGFWPRSLSPT